MCTMIHELGHCDGWAAFTPWKEDKKDPESWGETLTKTEEGVDAEHLQAMYFHYSRAHHVGFWRYLKQYLKKNESQTELVLSELIFAIDSSKSLEHLEMHCYKMATGPPSFVKGQPFRESFVEGGNLLLILVHPKACRLFGPIITRPWDKSPPAPLVHEGLSASKIYVRINWGVCTSDCCV